jgi:hypothetical protein
MASCGGAPAKGGPPAPPPDERPQTQTKATAQIKAEVKTGTKAETAAVTREGPTVYELMDERVEIMGLSIPTGMGSGEAANEQDALAAATAEAKNELSRFVALQAFRISDTYAGNVSQAARRVWDEKVAQLSEAYVKDAPVYKSAAQYYQETKSYTVYALVILNPADFKQAITDATAANAEFSRRARNDLIMMKMDAIIADFHSKYGQDDK